MTSSSEVISSLISTRDITIMQAFSVLYCTAIVHTESARANATKLCVVNVGLTTVRLVDAVLPKSEDCNPQYLMSQLAKCYLTKFALEFRRSSASPEINIESLCHCCKDPEIRNHNQSKGFVSETNTTITITPCLVRLVDKSDEYFATRNHSKLLWEGATVKDLIPFEFNSAQEYAISSTAGLVLFLLVLLPKDRAKSNKENTNNPNEPTIMANNSMFDNVDKYLNNLIQVFSANEAKGRIATEKVYGKINSKDKYQYAGPLFLLWYCKRDGVSDEQVRASLSNGTGKYYYSITDAQTVWQKKDGLALRQYDKLKALYNEALSIVKVIQKSWEDSASKYRSLPNAEAQFRQSSVQIDYEASMSKAISDLVKRNMNIKAALTEEQRHECHEWIDDISDRIAWMLRNRFLSLTTNLRENHQSHDTGDNKFILNGV